MDEAKVENPRTGERLMELAGVAGLIISLLGLGLQYREGYRNAARDDRMEEIEVDVAERDRIERKPGIAFSKVDIDYEIVGGGIIDKINYVTMSDRNSSW